MSGERWADLVDAEADQRDGYTTRLGSFERYARCGAFIAPVRGLGAGSSCGGERQENNGGGVGAVSSCVGGRREDTAGA